MPCPFFYPVQPLPWPNAPRLPLGDAYAGLCHADPACAAEPEPAVQRQLCNLGYARGRCARFPQAEGPDAVRFSVVEDAGHLIRLCWVRERNHYPFDHGPLEYSPEKQAFAAGAAEPGLERQARAYVASYLRRKARVPKPS
jgi:hypothetical protein